MTQIAQWEQLAYSGMLLLVQRAFPKNEVIWCDIPPYSCCYAQGYFASNVPSKYIKMFQGGLHSSWYCSPWALWLLKPWVGKILKMWALPYSNIVGERCCWEKEGHSLFLWRGVFGEVSSEKSWGGRGSFILLLLFCCHELGRHPSNVNLTCTQIQWGQYGREVTTGHKAKLHDESCLIDLGIFYPTVLWQAVGFCSRVSRCFRFEKTTIKQF